MTKFFIIPWRIEGEMVIAADSAAEAQEYFQSLTQDKIAQEGLLEADEPELHVPAQPMTSPTIIGTDAQS